MTWEGSSISGLGYFLEGNQEEDAEFVEVFLPNGGRSRKYAYYGKSPLVFYRAIEVEKEEDDPSEETPELLEDDEPVEVVYQPIVSAPLNPAMKDVFLFFKKSEERRRWRDPISSCPLILTPLVFLRVLTGFSHIANSPCAFSAGWTIKHCLHSDNE